MKAKIISETIFTSYEYWLEVEKQHQSRVSLMQNTRQSRQKSKSSMFNPLRVQLQNNQRLLA
ncbi:MAG: hypothetical protein V1775_03655 [Bacteroidota bacterium]